MGYCMSQSDSRFKIKVENQEKALAALKASNDKINSSTLQHALYDLGWEVEENEVGEVVDIQFASEKLWGDDDMFRTISPFVEDGSFIQMTGEDGHLWRWVFDGEKMEEVDATITW